MQAPSVGRIVHVVADPQDNNGADTAAAVITRVFNQLQDGGWLVNLRVLLDGKDTPWKTSVKLVEGPEDRTVHTCWYPPRV